MQYFFFLLLIPLDHIYESVVLGNTFLSIDQTLKLKRINCLNEDYKI